MEGGAFPADLFQGVRILTPVTPLAPAEPAPLPGTGLILIPLHDPFSATETDRASVILAERAPGPQLRLHPADAARLQFKDGEVLAVEGRRVLLALDKHVPMGHAALTTRRTTPRRLMPERAQ